jgi:poly(3-hydroxybutyrate) depolymerase
MRYAASPQKHGDTRQMLLYQWHEFWRSGLAPYTYFADAGAKMYASQDSWLSTVPGAQRTAAAFELMYRLGKEYEKPEFNIHSVDIDGVPCPVVERVALEKPFCRLTRFKRFSDDADRLHGLKDDPTVLVVAPLSGHHATLLRDTVRTLLADHKVFVTDWTDARMVPTDAGTFGLDDYVAYIEEFIRHIGTDNLHVISVCQPTVPVLAAISLMAGRGERLPRSMVMMGGPIDPRESPTSVNNLATRQPLSWFENHVIHTVPANYPGSGRQVYPGFLQHLGFVAMNPERHAQSHWDFYQDLLQGDLDDAQSHRKFYDEYNAVLDMPARYYLDTIRLVFQEFLLPRGLWDVAGERVDPSKIRDCALLTIEGELDDISGEGQTRAAHKLCTGIPQANQQHMTVEGAGHYGIFSGRRWRTQVYPQVKAFIATHAAAGAPAMASAVAAKANPPANKPAARKSPPKQARSNAPAPKKPAAKPAPTKKTRSRTASGTGASNRKPTRKNAR